MNKLLTNVWGGLENTTNNNGCQNAEAISAIILFIAVAAFIIFLLVLIAGKSNKPKETKPDKFEEIKKYKELLDSGAITQEEYDAKKKELL